MIKFGSGLMEAVDQIGREKGISKDIIIQSIKDAMVTAYKKYSKAKEFPNLRTELNEKEGELGIYKVLEVVKEVEDDKLQITLKEAKKIDKNIEIGGEILIEVTPEDFGRIAAQAAKQVITQRIKEAERNLILEEYLEKKGTLLTGVIQRKERGNVIVSIGKAEAIMPPREQVPGEYYRPNDRVRVYVLDVKETNRLPQVIVSQAHPEIVRELFELEVPEIEDGLVEIVSIARQAGARTKIAVHSQDSEVDPVGACIGHRGSRIQTIVNELKNEKIDIVRYSEDPAEFIANALSPAQVESIEIMEDEQEGVKEALVVVPDEQLSLAIGREGQNARLAHKLTGWKIDIKSISQIEAMETEEAGNE